jgi:sugar (pentulose or hexulose) kinase
MILTMDNRAVREGQELYDAFPELNVLSKNIGVAANSTAAKVLWLKKNSPEDIKKTALIGNIQHFFTHKLGLGLFTDQAHAYANGFFDLNQKEYSIALCDYLGFPVEKLGEKPLLGDTVLGKITKFGRVDLGKEVPVILGSYDVGCGMLGLGCNPSSKTIIADVTGTYDHIGRLTSNVDERFMCINGPIKDSYVLFAGAVVSGPNLEWYIKTFFPNEDSSIINRLFTLYPFDGNNKVFLSKDLNSGDGIIRGINFTTTNGDIFRAIIEGSTFPLINAVKAVTNEGKEKFDCIRIGGGSARSDKWSQLKADIFGIRVEKVANFEISSVGAAILASVAIGYYKDYSNAMNSLIQVEQVFNPISDLTKRYETRYLEYLNRLQQ